MEFIDLRSDTVTEPTEEMRIAMSQAIVGDDQLDGDPTVQQLEELAAQIMGKEAALYVPSGCMGNQTCIFYHASKAPRGSQIIASEECHVISYETGSVVYLSGLLTRPIKTQDGLLSKELIENEVILDPNPNQSRTAVITIENPTSVGTVLSLEKQKAIYEYAKSINIPLHLDGARIFNAAANLNVDVKEIAQYSDTLLFCLSKALGAPVGSMICGTKEFIKEARKIRKMLGGSMRQAGILAAAGLVSLQKIRFEIKKDNEITLFFAQELAKLPQLKVLVDMVQINMIYFFLPNFPSEKQKELVQYLFDRKIKIMPSFDPSQPLRFVIHHFIREKQVLKVIQTLKEFFEQLN